MKTLKETKRGLHIFGWLLGPACAGLLVCAGFLAPGTKAAGPGLPGTNYLWLDYWTFSDTTNWLTDFGYAPISFTNLTAFALPEGNALVVDSTNTARLNYNIYETNGWTNLTVDTGSVMFWFAPNWASTNQGGVGPSEWSRLLETGVFTTNASIGWWSIFLSPDGCNLYFSAQTNNGTGTTNYLTAPVSFASNQWHMLALTYSSTNTSFYLDGQLATNGTGMTVWPGLNVLTNGFWIGSDSNGVSQAHGMFADISTYSVVLDSNTINANFILSELFFDAVLFNGTNYVSAPSTPAFLNGFDAITGPGYLQQGANFTGTSGCVTNSNVWITNVSATLTNGSISLTFGISGGSNGVPYDVFATAALTGSYPSNSQWAWFGQGYQCNMYTITNLPTNSACFLILGKPQDSDSDGLTDAYELLVSKTNPYSPDTYGGIPDAWLAMHGYNSKLLSGYPSADPDGDALLNWQEYLWGTDPQVNNGFGIWVASPAGVTGIP